MFSKLFVKDKEFYKRLLVISLPIIAQSCITIGVNMMDTIMLGKFGETQLSASTLANDFINIFQILCMGMGCGCAVLTAQYWGKGDVPSLKKAVSVMLKFMLAISTCFTVAVILAPGLIMTIYTDVPEVIEKGIIYFRWSFPTFILMGISLTLTQILRSVRLVKIPLYASITSFFVNIFFNWVFIFGKFGFPEMQIAGAALGTVLARVIEALIIGGYFFFIDKTVEFRIPEIFKATGEITKLYFKYSIPVMASDALLAFGNSAVAIIVGHMGKTFTAAYAIISLVQRFSTVFTSGIGQASATITGNRLGEGKKDQAYAEAITMLSIAVVLGLVSGLIIVVIGPIIVNFYDVVQETKDTALLMLDAIAIMIVFQSMQSVITKGVLRGGGDTKFCFCIDAVFLWIISVPLGYLTGLVLNLNAFIVVLSLKADWIVKSLIGTYRIITKKWMKKIV